MKTIITAIASSLFTVLHRCLQKPGLPFLIGSVKPGPPAERSVQPVRKELHNRRAHRKDRRRTGSHIPGRGEAVVSATVAVPADVHVHVEVANAVTEGVAEEIVDHVTRLSEISTLQQQQLLPFPCRQSLPFPRPYSNRSACVPARTKMIVSLDPLFSSL